MAPWKVETRREESESWGDRRADMRLCAGVHDKQKQLLKRRQTERLCYDTGAACRNLRPSERERRRAVRGTAPQEKSHRSSGFFWVVHFNYSTHAHIHSSGCPVCISFSKVQRSNMPRPRRRKGKGGGVGRKVTSHKTCSYSQWCHIVNFSWRKKSLMDFS